MGVQNVRYVLMVHLHHPLILVNLIITQHIINVNNFIANIPKNLVILLI